MRCRVNSLIAPNWSCFSTKTLWFPVMQSSEKWSSFWNNNFGASFAQWLLLALSTLTWYHIQTCIVLVHRWPPTGPPFFPFLLIEPYHYCSLSVHDITLLYQGLVPCMRDHQGWTILKWVAVKCYFSKIDVFRGHDHLLLNNSRS